ncbi:MAG: cytosol nonspecific dipeptidase, partial [Lentisphaeria bacterium]|nr:cytosol nonspecific dipeptidase [Lentisphaeria bacterium]
MNTAVEKLLPDNRYWYYFLKICSIPHPSGHEEALRGYLADEAAKHNLFCRVDRAGNLAIDRPAAAGFDNSPTGILQAQLELGPP